MASVNAGHAWEIVLNRDRHGDGLFVYAVVSTGVYCRPLVLPGGWFAAM